MLYFLLFVLEVFVLYLLSRRVIKKLFRILPVWLIAILFLPGTLIHELSHWAMASILFVHTGKFSVWPKREENVVILGSVAIAKTDFVRRTLIGVAPFLFGTAIILGVLISKIYLALVAYIIFEIGNTMFSSRKDLEGTWIFFVFSIAIAIAFYFLGVRIIIPSEIFEVIKQADNLLLIPISLDLVLVTILSILVH